LQNVTAEIQKQGVKLGGVFVTMFNNKAHGETIKEFRNILGNRLLNSIIPFSQCVCESQNMNLTIEEYFEKRNTPDIGTTRKVANAYRDLTDEILKKCEQN
jgi:nitrogenase subunit NifH